MKHIAYEAIVESGQITLPPAVHLPDHTKVLIVVLGVEGVPTLRVGSPRLTHPEQASDFAKEVVTER
jgi:hypothetical protein